MTPTCPYCGAEMVVEGETIEDVSGSILLLGGWCLCEKCGSRSPYVNAVDDAQLEERAISAAMQRYIEPAKGCCWCIADGVINKVYIRTDDSEYTFVDARYCPKCGKDLEESK